MSVTVSFACTDCGCPVDLTDRGARLLAAEDRDPLCGRCKSNRKTASRREHRVITESERRFWTDRFGVQGAVELALSIWGPIQRAAPTPAAAELEYLAASAPPDLQSVA